MEALRAELTLEIVLTLAVTLLALGLFVWRRVRLDAAALIVLALLVVLGLVTPQESVSGFSNPATVTVALMLALSAGLLRTGFVDLIGSRIARLAGESELRLLLLMMAVVVPLSAFINNTAAVAILIPMIVGLSRSMEAPPSRFLLHLSYSGMLGGTLTLIGTSTNLLVAGLIVDLGLPQLELFSITPPALIVVGIGMAYLLTVGRWLAPDRESAAELVEMYELHEYLTAVLVREESDLVGRTLGEEDFCDDEGLRVVRIERDGSAVARPEEDTVIEPEDLLLVKGSVHDIARLRDHEAVEISGARRESGAAEAVQHEEEYPRILAEVMVTPASAAVERTLGSLDLRERHGIGALALLRHGQPVREPIGEVRLQGGDLLLVQGERENLRALHETGNFALIQAVDLPEKRREKLKVALPILIGVVLLPALDLMPIMVSALLGVVAMLVTGCLRGNEVYEDMDWMVVILLGAVLPLGIAMQNTGTASFLAAGVLGLTRPLGPHGVLAAFFLLTTTLTGVISNNAAAVVLVPIAVAAAQPLGLSPMPFVVAVMFGASNAFMTPVGYQTNTFVYGPGGYRFSDFVRVGTPLALITAAAATFAIPLFFPF